MEEKLMNQGKIQQLKVQKNLDQNSQRVKAFRSKISQHFSNKIQRTKMINSCSDKKQSTHQFSKLHQSKILNQDIVLVYLMYKQQKFSIFLQKETPLQVLLKMLYKQIYLYQKQTYSTSNTIIKENMMKISGFQTLDNDLNFNFCLKNGIGKIKNQKFITPLLSENSFIPFKIYRKIHENQLGIQYICRNYNNGQYYILTSIKKMNLSQENKSKIAKQLKFLNSLNCFGQNKVQKINYFQTDKHFFLFRQNQAANLRQYIESKSHFDQNQIFCVLYSVILLLEKLSQIKCSFRELNLNNFVIDYQGQIKLSSFVLLSYNKIQKPLSERQYFVFVNKLLKQMLNLEDQKKDISNYSQSFLKFISYVEQNTIQTQCQNFNQSILQNWIQQRKTQKNQSFSQVQIHLSQQTKKKYFEQLILMSGHFQQQQSLNQLKQEIRLYYNQMNLKVKQHSKETQQLINNFMLHSHHQTLQAKQTIRNFQQLNKDINRQQEHLHLNKNLINQIINQFNKNQNYISEIKMNNIASIKFYLQKSEKQKERRMLTQIKQKYKKYLKPEIKQDFIFKQKNNENLIIQEEDKQNDRSNSIINSSSKKKSGLPYFLSKSKTTQTKRIGSSEKNSILKQLFVDEKAVFKHQKLQLKKKQYEIYLLQAQKQYNKIKVYKNQTNLGS